MYAYTVRSPGSDSLSTPRPKIICDFFDPATRMPRRVEGADVAIDLGYGGCLAGPAGRSSGQGAVAVPTRVPRPMALPSIASSARVVSIPLSSVVAERRAEIVNR